MYSIQALVPGPAESWQTVREYEPLPPPPPDVRVQSTSAAPVRGPRPILFLWTCDTEVTSAE